MYSGLPRRHLSPNSGGGLTTRRSASSAPATSAHLSQKQHHHRDATDVAQRPYCGGIKHLWERRLRSLSRAHEEERSRATTTSSPRFTIGSPATPPVVAAPSSSSIDVVDVDRACAPADGEEHWEAPKTPATSGMRRSQHMSAVFGSISKSSQREWSTSVARNGLTPSTGSRTRTDERTPSTAYSTHHARRVEEDVEVVDDRIARNLFTRSPAPRRPTTSRRTFAEVRSSNSNTQMPHTRSASAAATSVLQRYTTRTPRSAQSYDPSASPATSSPLGPFSTSVLATPRTTTTTATATTTTTTGGGGFLLPSLSSRAVRPLLTVVLDLDETLVNNRRAIKGDRSDAIVRPYCIHMLHALRSIPELEMVLWTASTQETATTVARQLDADDCIFDSIIPRHSSWFTEPTHTKNLHLLGRDVERVVIVDNAASCCKLFPGNSVLIRDFQGVVDARDAALINVYYIITSLLDGVKEGRGVSQRLADLAQEGQLCSSIFIPLPEAWRGVPMHAVDPAKWPPYGDFVQSHTRTPSEPIMEHWTM